MPIEELKTIHIAAATATGVMLLILAKSLKDFTRTGPQIRDEVLRHFRFYLVYAVSRLFFWGWLACFFWSLLGGILYLEVANLVDIRFSGLMSGLASLFTVGAASVLSFCDQLLHKPSNICAGWQYRTSRLYGLWHRLSPRRIRFMKLVFWGGIGIILGAGILNAAMRSEWDRALISVLMAALILGYFEWRRRVESVPAPAPMSTAKDKPNLVMIGCDTLRLDHLSAAGYHRQTTPFIDELIRKSTFFTQCYTPLARTAPSLVSLFSGVWPHRHRVRDNFSDPSSCNLPEDTLPSVLRRHGYRSVALGDWCGSDLKKFGFGFDEVETPDDQWNLKYYLRQGPMQLKLFLSLFFNNALGRVFLPEIYYQSGNPLDTRLGNRVCQKIFELGPTGQPFFLNAFIASTHAPFGSEYPYYLKFSDRNYRGESKFVMFSFQDPNEIIEKQELTPDKFDLDQIIRLYDGCVSRFDAEVARIAGYLEDCGLADNTILVVYSDHGIEFFENQSWGQGNTVFGNDFGAKIPLIIHDPRRPGAGKVEQIVRTIDIAPTLLELCGAPISETMCGQSLVPVITDRVDMDLTAYQETGIWLGNIPGLHPERLTYPNLLDLLEIPDKKTATLVIKPEYIPLMNRAKDRMLRKGRWKLIYQPLRSGALYRLFDMVSDPECRRDVSARHPEIFESLKSELAWWLQADALEADNTQPAAPARPRLENRMYAG
jgi:arylsulfatase A-like enzyme